MYEEDEVDLIRNKTVVDKICPSVISNCLKSCFSMKTLVVFALGYFGSEFIVAIVALLLQALSESAEEEEEMMEVEASNTDHESKEEDEKVDLPNQDQENEDALLK